MTIDDLITALDGAAGNVVLLSDSFTDFVAGLSPNDSGE
jgi:hypothetical protein